MPDLNRPPLDSAFHSIQRRMVQLLEYATTAAPLVAHDPKLLPELADSVVVLVVAPPRGVFHGLVRPGPAARGACCKEPPPQHGHVPARSCDLPTLVKLV